MRSANDNDIPIRIDGLQLGESRPLQRTIWMTQRFLWLFFACLIVAALSGATGRGGFLAEKTVTAEMASAVLPRIARRGSGVEVRVTFLQDAHDHRLLLPSDLLERFEVETVTPRPVAEMAEERGTLLVFAADGQGPHHVTLHLRSTIPALGRMTVTADGAVLSTGLVILP